MKQNEKAPMISDRSSTSLTSTQGKMEHVTIHTNKMAESIAFYQNVVGLKIQADMRGKGGPSIVFLANAPGNTCIELIESEKEGAFSGGGISIGFHTENVEAKREELIAEGYEPTPIISPNPHVRFFFVKDPSGVEIQFI